MAPTSSPPSTIIRELTVDAVMRSGVVVCPPAATVRQLAGLMVAEGIHALLVGPPGAALPMIVSDLDLVRAAVGAEQPATAANLASDPASTVSPGAPLTEVIAQMAELRTAHVLVTDPADRRPLGMVSSFDLVAVLGGVDPRSARILRPAPARPLLSRGDLERVPVADVMSHPLVTYPGWAPASGLAASMVAHRVRCVAVTGTEDRSASLLRWALADTLDVVSAAQRAGLNEPAAAVAEGDPFTVAPQAAMARAAALMAEHDSSHVLAVGDDGVPVGMVSTLDVASVLAAG